MWKLESIAVANPGFPPKSVVVLYYDTFFKKNILEDMSSFCGATDTPVLDFWWRLLWVSKPEWVALFMLGGGIGVTHSLRFTFGATPVDLLAASMAAELSLPCTCEALVGLETGSYHAAAHHVRSGRCSTGWAIPAQRYDTLISQREGHHPKGGQIAI